MTVVHEKSHNVGTGIHYVDECKEQPWNLMFKTDPTPEELELAARYFVAACWELNDMEEVRSIKREPGSYDAYSGQEVPVEEGDTTWFVTDGEHRAWVTRYGLNSVPVWSVSVDEQP